MAPATFAAGDGFSYVRAQPGDDRSRHEALKALVACPTGSIGTVGRHDVRPAIDAFPEPIDGDVHFCGYTSKDSFGAWSYLVRRPDGNLLVDSPRAASPLLTRITAMGGVSRLALTHQDDVADHARFRALYGCERVIHRDDAHGELLGAERLLTGTEPVALGDDLVAIPTPGHTRGHVVYLYRETYLFTGDHLAWSASRGHLYAFRDACWYSWKEQIRSMERLLEHRFTWVLPGHGARWTSESPEAMREAVARCVAWMRGR